MSAASPGFNLTFQKGDDSKMRIAILVTILAFAMLLVLASNQRSVNAQAPIGVEWSVNVDSLSHRWVATATAGLVGSPFTPNSLLELHWPPNFPAARFCMDTFYMSSTYPQSSPASYAVIDHIEVRGGGAPLTVRRVCYDSTTPDIYIESFSDNSKTYHLTLAGDLLR